jgi:hypothetical protein
LANRLRRRAPRPPWLRPCANWRGILVSTRP